MYSLSRDSTHTHFSDLPQATPAMEFVRCYAIRAPKIMNLLNHFTVACVTGNSKHLLQFYVRNSRHFTTTPNKTVTGRYVPHSTWGKNWPILCKVSISCEGNQTAANLRSKSGHYITELAVFANINTTVLYIYYDLVGNINFIESWWGWGSELLAGTMTATFTSAP